MLWCHSEQLSSGTSGVYSPRLSPDQCRIIYLECSVYGPHMQCSRLCMVRAGTSFPTWDIFTFSKHNNSTFDLFLFQYDWYTKKTTLVLDVVNRSAEGEKYQVLTSQMHLLIQDILNLFISVICQMALLVSTALSCLPSVGQLTVSVSSLLLLRGAAKYCILSTIIYPSLPTEN